MTTLRPFPALRARPELAPRIASPPYDVVDTDEARRLAEGRAESFLHVTRPEIDLPEGASPVETWEQGARALRRMIDEGWLVRDEAPSLFVYRQNMGEHEQTGIVGCCSVDEYDAGLVKKHEQTRPAKEEDRMRHMLAISAQPGPVIVTYRGRDEIDRLAAAAATGEPLYDVEQDGARHRIWRMPAAEPVSEQFEHVPALYIADGHHRSAAASRARAALRASSPGGGEAEEEHDFFLAALFPAAELQILAYNRVVTDLGGLDSRELLDRVRAVMEVTPDADPVPSSPGRLAMYLEGRWWGLRAPEERKQGEDPVAAMDAAILQSLVLGPLLGIDDPRTSDRMDFVGGIHGAKELARRADRTGGVAFSLHPVTVEELMTVADAGRFLPPKSTWFEPKLRSGLLVHQLDPGSGPR